MFEGIRKRKGISIFMGVLCLCLCYGAYAYLADADRAENRTTIGGSNVTIVEEFTPPDEVTPGTSFTKDVSVRNDGPNDCYVRVRCLFSDSRMEKYCEVDWNTADWTYNSEDGYYYYTDVLKDGAVTPSLMTTVKVKNETPESEIRDFEIIVYAESYQSEGFDTYQEAWSN